MYVMLGGFGFICFACCAYGLIAECVDRSKKKKKRAKRKIKEKKELQIQSELMMKTAMHDLMDKNRLGSASTAANGRSSYGDDGSIINNDDISIEMTKLRNGKGRKKRHNPQSDISEKDFKQHSKKAKLMRLDLDG
jgi:hypothetical protein